MGCGSVAGICDGELEESVALPQFARSGAEGRCRGPGSARPVTRRGSSSEMSSGFARWSARSGPAIRVTVIWASPGSAIRDCTTASGYGVAASSMAGTEKSRLAAMRCRSRSGMSGRATRRRHSVNASACLPIQDAHTACSSARAKRKSVRSIRGQRGPLREMGFRRRAGQTGNQAGSAARGGIERRWRTAARRGSGEKSRRAGRRLQRLATVYRVAASSPRAGTAPSRSPHRSRPSRPAAHTSCARRRNRPYWK